jgi:hypothetical protein
MFMEMITVLWSWLTGHIPVGDSDVWDVLWDADAEWLALPPGQHRAGTSMVAILDRLSRERDAAAAAAKHDRRKVIKGWDAVVA